MAGRGRPEPAPMEPRSSRHIPPWHSGDTRVTLSAKKAGGAQTQTRSKGEAGSKAGVTPLVFLSTGRKSVLLIRGETQLQGKRKVLTSLLPSG